MYRWQTERLAKAASSGHMQNKQDDQCGRKKTSEHSQTGNLTESVLANTEQNHQKTILLLDFAAR